MFTIYASNYAPINPLVPPCDINLIPIGYVGENLARCLVFDLSECVEQFGDGGFVISFLRHGDELPYLVTNTDRLEDNAIWNITDTDTAVDGYGLVQLQYIVDDVVCKSALYRTVTFESNGITGDVPDPYEDLLAQIAAYASTAQSSAAAAVAAAATATTAVEEGVKTERSQRIAADNGLSARIDSLQASVGAPLTTTQASAMTDVNKIYVYTGSETGYTFGNWYYYNGAEWVSGGVYNSEGTNIDDSLMMAGFAADAKAAGDRINAAFITEQTSGSIASFADGADGVPVKDLVVNITPKQASGTPSPDNVLPISGWTGANISRTGKNLLPNNGTSGTTAGITYTINGDGSVTCVGTVSGTTAYTLCAEANMPKMKAGCRYVITAGSGVSSSGVRAVCSILDKNNNTVSWGDITTAGGITYTANEGDHFGSFYLRGNTSGTAVDTTIYPMIRLVAFDDTYEPYSGDIYNINFGTAGTVYQASLDVPSGMLTVTHGYFLFDGTGESWESGGTGRFAAPISGSYRQGYTRIPVISNMGVYSTGSSVGTIFLSNSMLYYYPTSDITTLSAFTSWLATNNLQVVYPLAQPVSYQLDPVSIASLLANNNIFADTGSVASCEYRADTKLYIEHLTTPDSDMVADSNITSGSYFMVNNTLYLATAAIASGATIVPGTNCTETNLASALNAINS